jgi:hypothetical protein
VDIPFQNDVQDPFGDFGGTQALVFGWRGVEVWIQGFLEAVEGSLIVVVKVALVVKVKI